MVDGDEVVINGRKWWSTGVGHPDCKIYVFMGLTDPDADRHHRHSMVLVPRDAPGVKVERMLSTMGFYDEPLGHGEVSFTDVRVPARQHHLRSGRGVRDRAGPAGARPGAPLHAADRARRGGAGAGLPARPRAHRVRQAAGQPRRQPRADRRRPDRDRLRPGCWSCNAAWKLDIGGPLNALSEVSQIKVAVPDMAQRSSTWPSSSTAAAGCPTTSRWPPPGSAPAPCGSPTAPTRCTAGWSPASSSASTPTAAGRDEAGPGHRRRLRARRGADRGASGSGATRCSPPTAPDGRQSCRSTSPPTTTGPRRVAEVERALGRPRRAGQQRRRRRRRPARRGRPSTSGSWITEINLFGVVRGTRTFVPLFKRQRSGQSSTSPRSPGLCTRPAWRPTTPSRPASWRFTETTGHELAAYGVRAMAVCPSYFRTNLMASMQGADEAVGAVVAQLVEDVAAHRRRHRRGGARRARPRRRSWSLPDEAARAA